MHSAGLLNAVVGTVLHDEGNVDRPGRLLLLGVNISAAFWEGPQDIIVRGWLSCVRPCVWAAAVWSHRFTDLTLPRYTGQQRPVFEF